MTRPHDLKTRIFLDGGNPDETLQVIERLGFLDGQTTNPTLITRHPAVVAHHTRGESFSASELLAFYRFVVTTLSHLMPDGSISVEVYADPMVTADAMLAQGCEMYSWIPNAHVKFPTTTAGLEAAERAVADGMRVNMTLCFSQPQAAAIYAATKGAKPGQVFVSPFIGRLDDRGDNGLDLVANILQMFTRGDGHVQVLTASVRSLDHLRSAIHLGSDLITAPAEVLSRWAEEGLALPGPEPSVHLKPLRRIPYVELKLDRPWREYDLRHELTDVGVSRFARDWNAMLERPAPSLHP